MTHVILVAGASGSGKSRLVARAGCPCLRLDDFYRDADAPGLPRTLGIVDWDDPATWNGEAAVKAIAELAASGHTWTPDYSIPLSKAVGRKHLDLGAPPALLLAEGIFASEALALCRAAGLDAEGIYLDRSRTLVAWWRLKRDLKQRRKSPLVLVRRGFSLWRAQPALRRKALAAGFAPVSMAQAMARIGSARRAAPVTGERSAGRPD